MRVTFHSAASYLYDHGDGHKFLSGRGSKYLAKTPERPGLTVGDGARIDLGIDGIVTAEQMEAIYDNLRDSRDGSSLGSRPRDYKSGIEDRVKKAQAKEPDASPERKDEIEKKVIRETKEAVHYLDLTLELDKSWSVLYAAYLACGDEVKAEILFQCMRDAIEPMLEFLQDECGYAKTGTDGKIRLKQDRFIATSWEHTTSRTGDPFIHIHLALLNRAKASNGEWYALDTEAIRKARSAAFAVYEKAVETFARDRLGIAFEWREDMNARQIVGISQEIKDLFSTRRAAINERLKPLIAQYEAMNGKMSKWLISRMAQDITLATRPRKKQYNEAKLVKEWTDRLDNKLAVSFADVIREVKKAGRQQATYTTEPFSREKIIRAAVADVDAMHRYWTRNEMIWALRKYTLHLPTDSRSFIEGLADEAIASHLVYDINPPELFDTPMELRRLADGRSIFSRPRAQDFFCTTAQRMRDEGLIAGSDRRGGIRITMEHAVELANREQLAGSARTAFIRFFTMGYLDNALNAPAGSGKTTLMGVIARVSEELTGIEALGLATSQDATNLLSKAGLKKAVNIEKLFTVYEKVIGQEYKFTNKAAYDKACLEARAKLIEECQIVAGQVVIIDECSQIDFKRFTELRDLFIAEGAMALWTGDTEQTSAVGVSGAFSAYCRELADRLLELDTVYRFSNDWEGEASLGIRDGNAEVLADYYRNGCFQAGSLEDMQSEIADDYLADFIAGNNPIGMTSSNVLKVETNMIVHNRMRSLGLVKGRSIKLDNGQEVAAGDWISAGDTTSKLTVRDKKQSKIARREVFEVTHVSLDKHITVRPVLGQDDNGKQRYGPKRELPPDYDYELAYFVTVNTAQGRTEGRGHLLITPDMNKRGFLVGMTRGRHGNYGRVVLDGEHTEFQTILRDLVQRKDRELSTIEKEEELWEETLSLSNVGPRLSYVADTHHRERLDQLFYKHLGDQAEKLDDSKTKNTLYSTIRSAEFDGLSVEEIVAGAINMFPLDAVDDLARVMLWRVRRVLGEMTVSRETSEYSPQSFHDLVTPGTPDVHNYAVDVARAMDLRREVLGKRALAAPPAYLEWIGSVPNDPLDRMEWTAKAAEVEAYRERWSYRGKDPIGFQPSPNNPEKRVQWQQAYKALGCPEVKKPMADRSDLELQTLIVEYQRISEFEPRYVGQELADALKAARSWEGQVARGMAKLNTVKGAEAKKIAARVESAKAEAKRMNDLAAELREQDNIRREFVKVTEEKRLARDEALKEINSRYPNRRLINMAMENAAVNNLPPEPVTKSDDARDNIATLRAQLLEEHDRQVAEHQARTASHDAPQRFNGLERS